MAGPFLQMNQLRPRATVTGSEIPRLPAQTLTAESHSRGIKHPPPFCRPLSFSGSHHRPFLFFFDPAVLSSPCLLLQEARPRPSLSSVLLDNLSLQSVTCTPHPPISREAHYEHQRPLPSDHPATVRLRAAHLRSPCRGARLVSVAGARQGEWYKGSRLGPQMR